MTDYAAHLAAYQALVEPYTPGLIALRDKRPLPGSHGYKDASWDLDSLPLGWTHIGLAVSDKLGFVDVDDLSAWQQLLGDHEPPETLIVHTRRGFHAGFLHDGAKPRFPTGIDWKANKGHVVAPGIEPYRVADDGEVICCPVLHISGSTAGFELRTVAVSAHRLAPLPDWTARVKARRQSAAQAAAGMAGTGRNNTLTSGAGRLRAEGADDTTVRAWCRDRNSRFVDPMDDREVEAIVESILRYPPHYNYEGESTNV